LITLIGKLEKEHPVKFEHTCWKQLMGAWQVRLKLVGHHYKTMEEALDSYTGPRAFFIPPGRTKSMTLADYIPPTEVAFIFGCPGDNLVKYVQENDTVVSITTPGTSDMMAVSAAGIVLYEYR
jgi:hypothetical protein